MRDAIESDDAPHVRRLLDEVTLPWPKLLSRFGTKESLLTCAAMANAATVVNLLLDAGAEVDEIGGLKQTALEISVQMGHREVVLRLLQERAQPTRPGRAQGIATALEQAAIRGDVELVDILLRFGASPDAVCQSPNISLFRIYGEVLRHLVAAGGTLPDEIIRLLEKHEALGD